MMENRDKQLQAVSQQIRYSGPLPTASEFAGYEQAMPGAAERILKMAEEQQSHRHAVENKALEGSLKSRNKGQNMAFVIALASLVAVGLCAVFAQPVASIAPAIIAITSLASVFINQKK
jgi:uncharacterized membrane protein